MTREEIAKAAGEYAHNIEISHPGIQSKTASFQGYYDGYIECQNYWEEANRWIPIKEKLPEIREKGYFIMAKKFIDGNICLRYIETGADLYFLEIQFTHWKEAR